MTNGDDRSVGSGGSLSPTEAFDLIGHEVRLGIVRELATVRRMNWQWQGLTFAELRKAVGVEDAGNFSYHLDKLREHFVVKDGDEYKLTYPGMRVAGAVISGTYTERVEPREERIDVACPACDEQLRVELDQEFLSMQCPDHDTVFGTYLPPGAARGRSVVETVELATLDGRQDLARARAGACPHCWGPTDVSLPAEEVIDPETGETIAVPDDQVYARVDCDRCGMVFWLPPGAFLADEPAVVSFLYERGIDVRERTFPELSFASPHAATVTGDDPTRVRVDVDADGDTLAVWLDEDTAIVETAVV